MTRVGLRTFSLVVLIAAPLMAQQTDGRLEQLERRLDDLSRQAAEIRQELNRLKGQQQPAPAPQPQPEDLTKVEVVPAPQPAEAPLPTTATTSMQTPATQTPPPALTDVQTVNNVVNPAASKVFNPDTSVIGNFIGKAGQRNDFEFGSDPRPPFVLDEAEVAFEAFVDPYVKAKFFLSITPHG